QTFLENSKMICVCYVIFYFSTDLMASCEYILARWQGPDKIRSNTDCVLILRELARRVALIAVSKTSSVAMFYVILSSENDYYFWDYFKTSTVLMEESSEHMGMKDFYRHMGINV
ncbi:hypothetical protein ACJX0J_032208, partial [Zea mays]